MLHDKKPKIVQPMTEFSAPEPASGAAARTAEPAHPLAGLGGPGAATTTATPFSHFTESTTKPGPAAATSPSPGAAAPVVASTNSPRSIERVVNPQTKQAVYKYVENGKVRWMDESQIAFMNGAGQDVINTGEAHGFSSFGSMFMAAQASLESGWGKGNWMPETHNLFSMMGGSNPKYKNSHGTLQTYGSNQDSTTDYIKQLDSKWGGATQGDGALFRQNGFTPDDANKAFHQKQYYPTAQQRNQGIYAYDADPSADYSRSIMQRMQYMAGPMLAMKEQALAQEKDPTRRQQLEQEVAKERADYDRLNASLAPPAQPHTGTTARP